jgi:hypothetical protein
VLFRSLEIGPATGFLTFHMEKTAREVIAVELPMDRSFWNSVPYEKLGLARRQSEQWSESELQFFDHIGRIRNGFWMCHEKFGSRAKVYNGSSENLPDALGKFDVAVLPRSFSMHDHPYRSWRVVPGWSATPSSSRHVHHCFVPPMTSSPYRNRSFFLQ